MRFHPIKLVRVMGLLDGLSLLTLVFIAMPLKYWADIPEVVSINGRIHGGIFMAYLIAILYAQLRVRWNGLWSLVALIAAFVPFGNFVLDSRLKKIEPQYPVQPFQKYWLVYLIIFFSFIDLFAQLPVMSTFALSVGSTAFIAGIVVGLYSLTNTFGNVLSGILTDRIGAYRILLFGLITTVLALLSYQLVDDPTTLLIVRCVHGFCSGFITPAAFTMLANTTKDVKHGSKSAITGSYVGIAAMIGPAASGILASQTSVPNVLGFVAFFGLVMVIAMVLFLRGTGNVKRNKEVAAVRLIWNQGLLKAFGGAFFLMFSQGGLAYLLPMYVEGLGYDSRMSGTLLSIFGIVAVIIFVSPTNRIFDKVNSSYTLVIGLGLLGVSQILISQTQTVLSLYLTLALYGVGFSLLFPSINTLLIESTKKETRGKAYGYFYAFFSIGVVVGSSLLGSLPFDITGNFIFTGIVLFFFCIIVLAWMLRAGSRELKWKKSLS